VLVLGHPAADHVVDALADVDGVVADALVVPTDESELHGGLDVEAPGPTALEHLGDVLAVQIVEDIVEEVEGLRLLVVGVGVRLDGLSDEVHRLVAHRLQQAADPGLLGRACEPLGPLDDVDHEVARPFVLRRGPDGRDEPAEVAGHRLLQGEELVAPLLDVERHLVEAVVGVDQCLPVLDVAPEQGLGPPRQGLGNQSGQAHEVVVHEVELVVEALASLHQRTSAARWSGSPVMR
jgi:hypothetical protein